MKKAITLLRATAEDRNANVSSLARTAGLPRATALRMIQTLEQEGFLLRIPGDDRVLLGPELLRLARNTDEQLLLREVSRPVIGDLVAAVRETVTLSVVAPDGGLDVVAPGRRARPAAPPLLGRSAFPAARERQRQGAPGHLRRRATRPLPRGAARAVHPLDDHHCRGVARGARCTYAKSATPSAGTRRERACPASPRGSADRGRSSSARSPWGGPTQRLDRQRGRHAVDHLLRAAGEIGAALRRGQDPPAVLEVIGHNGGPIRRGIRARDQRFGWTRAAPWCSSCHQDADHLGSSTS